MEEAALAVAVSHPGFEPGEEGEEGGEGGEGRGGSSEMLLLKINNCTSRSPRHPPLPSLLPIHYSAPSF